MLSILLSSKRIKDLTLRWARHWYRHVKKNHAWMKMVIKPLDVSIYCLHTMNCTMPQLLRCQRMIKYTLKAICDLCQINHRRCTLGGMSRYGLNPPKLTKNLLRQISHHAVSVSESSRVKADPLKRTCLTVLSIWDHDNATQIQPIQMVYVVVWCAQTSQWYKKHRAWISLPIRCPDILASYTLDVLIRSSLQQ